MGISVPWNQPLLATKQNQILLLPMLVNVNLNKFKFSALAYNQL